MVKPSGRLYGAILGALTLTLAGGGLDASATTATTATAERVAGSDFDPDGVFRRAVNLTEYGGLSFDPASIGNGQYSFTYPVTNTFLKRLPDGTYEPDLASEVEVVDPSTIRVVLRPDLQFSDGETLDAQAAVDSINRTLEAKAPGLRITGGLDLIESMEVVSDTEFVINLVSPAAGFFYELLSEAETTPVSPTTINAEGDHAQDVVTAGPFKIEAYEQGRRVVLVRNDLYWDAENVRLAGIEYIHTEGSAAATNALRSGAVDFALSPSLISHSDLEGLSPPLEGLSSQLPFAYWVNMCVTDESPLSDVRVRQALNHATDRDGVNRLLYREQSQPAWGLVPEGDPLYNADLEGIYAYDPDRARELLTEAGYPDGFTLRATTTTGDAQRIHEILQAQWEEVGVSTEITMTTNLNEDWYLAAGAKADINVVPLARGPLGSFPRLFATEAYGNVCDFTAPGIDECSADLMALDPSSEEYVERSNECQATFVEENAYGVLTVFNMQAAAVNSERVGDLSYQLDGILYSQPDVTNIYINS